MRLTNLTPHRLVVLDDDGATLLELPPADHPARLHEFVDGETAVDGVPVRVIRYGDPTHLPAPRSGVTLVVSRVLAQHIDRNDLLFPDREIRDDHGRVVACRGLARFVRAPPYPPLLRSGGWRLE